MLVRLFRIAVPSPHKYCLVYPPRHANSPKLAVFRQWLMDELAEEQGKAGRGGRRKADQRAVEVASTARSRRKPKQR